MVVLLRPALTGDACPCGYRATHLHTVVTDLCSEALTAVANMDHPKLHQVLY